MRAVCGLGAVLFALGFVVAGCAKPAIDILCPPAGVCPNTASGHGGGY